MVGKSNPPVWHWGHAGGELERELLALGLEGRLGRLGGLGLRHALLELVHAPGGVHELLLARVKRMAAIANADNDHRFGGPGLNHVAAGATDFCIHILWMYRFFHKRLEKIAPVLANTSTIFGDFARTPDELRRMASNCC
jgi:hypothetical protein